MRTWQTCIEMDEPIMVLESDAIFTRRFTWNNFKHPVAPVLSEKGFEKAMRENSELKVNLQRTFKDPKVQMEKWFEWAGQRNVSSYKPSGIIGLNNPMGATRKASEFNRKATQLIGFQGVPSVDSIGDKPLPQGLAGNSAYIIKPWAAKKLLEKVQEIGMWPNDALMCKQLFPWMQVVWPYYTKVQGTISSTTK
jgi:GR25 family glycosyltransferase involved in LPS biosynthesis